MPLYRCEQCGCVENTATGFYHDRDEPHWPESIRGRALCSACGPATDADGAPTQWGVWHGRFPQRPATGMRVDQHGYLWPAAGELPASVVIVGTAA